MFPFDHHGKLSRSKETIPNAAEFIQDFQLRATRMLEGCRARNITVRGRRVFFTGGLFRLVTNLNPLNAIGYGYIDVTETDQAFTISYYISFVQGAVVVSLVVLSFGAIIVFGDRSASLGAKLVIGLLVWFVLLILNWLSGVVYFPGFVKSLVRGGGRIEQIVGREPNQRAC